MTVSNGYCSLSELKARLTGLDDTTDDAALENVIIAVSRWIDRDRNRRIIAATETRYYSTEHTSRCTIDDLLSITTLKTDDNGDGVYETTWASTDYRLYPYNAGLDGRPYLEIETRPFCSYNFTTLPGAIQVVGSFGYAANVPSAIREACILVSLRVFGRKDLLYGISGSADLGTLQAIASLGNDGEVKALLAAVPRRVIG